MIRSLSLVAVAILSTALAAADSGWVTRAALPAARYDHQALLLPDGTVLVAGGTDSLGDLRASDAYDFRKNVWLRHCTMQFAHNVAGGFILLPLAKGHALALSPNIGDTSASEEYDPLTGAWHAIPQLPDDRSGFNAVTLANGDVLVVGGTPGALTGITFASCLLYHPTTATWTAAASLATGRTAFSLNLLDNGRVLASGGISLTSGFLASCETYVPELGAWRPAGALLTPRFGQSCLLSTGNIVAAGGCDWSGGGSPGSSEEYVPKTKSSTATNDCTVPGTTAFTVVRGGALRAGGVLDQVSGDSTTTVDVFSSKTHAWSAGPALQVARQRTAAVTLPSCEVLILGGAVKNGAGLAPLASSELYALRPYFIHASEAAGGTVGRTFSYQLDAATVATYTSVGLPPGIALNKVTGHLGGKPTTPGIYPVHIGATNQFGKSLLTLTLTIQPAPAASAPLAPQAGG